MVDANADNIELLGREERHHYDSSNAKGTRRGFTDSARGLKAWFKRSVLLSGSHYEALDHTPRVGAITHGWRWAALLSACFVALCLVANIAFALYFRLKYPINEDGIGDFGTLSCSEVLSTTSKIHIGINVLATILIASSNFNMQCLTAPTRSEVDRAHSSGMYLDIGIQSVKNLRYVRKWKTLFWAALMISTLPLHLLWNSAVFSITSANRYGVLVVQPDFRNDTDLLKSLDCANSSNTDPEFVTCQTLTAAVNSTSLQLLNAEDCIKAYSSKLATDVSNLLVVTKNANLSQSSSWKPPGNSSSLLAYFDSMAYSVELDDSCQKACRVWCTQPVCAQRCNTTTNAFGQPYNDLNVTDSCYKRAALGISTWRPKDITSNSDWLCNVDDVYSEGCNVKAAMASSTRWAILPENYLVDYCLASKSESTCKLQYSSTILYVVIACNAVKLIAILGHVLLNKDQIMATIGDALASFLEDNDPTTRGKCLHTQVLSPSTEVEYVSIWANLGPEQHPVRWVRDSKYVERWHQGASWKQVFFCVVLWLACISAGIHYLLQGIETQGSPNALKRGFGTMSINALVGVSSLKGGSVGSIITTSLLVNLPQVLFSSLYFLYNSIYTCMASAYEWSLYARFRKGLRVTDRQGSQRSTYWLQLPFKFSLPLLAASAVLHWLVSQSSFLVNLTILTVRGTPQTTPDQYLNFVSESGTTTAIGYSPQAMLVALCVATAMLIALIVVMQFKLTPGMPLVGSNSFGISAACHPPKDDGDGGDVARRKVMWGAVVHQTDAQPGHCCLTSLDVEPPRVGDFYAGEARFRRLR